MTQRRGWIARLKEKHQRRERAKRHASRVPRFEPLEERQLLALGVDALRLLHDTGLPDDRITADPTVTGAISRDDPASPDDETLTLRIDQDGDRQVDHQLSLPVDGGNFTYDPRDIDPSLSQYEGEMEVAVQAVLRDQGIVVQQTAWRSLIFTLDPDARNRAPYEFQPLDSIRIRGDEETRTASLSDVFRDPDPGDTEQLEVTATTADHWPFTVQVEDRVFTVRRRPDDSAGGDYSVTLTATDPGGLQAVSQVEVQLEQRNSRPYVVSPIPDQLTSLWGESLWIDAAPHFRDDDPGLGGMLSYRVEANTGPEWLNVLSDANGLLQLHTPPGHGSARVTVSATDTYGLSAATSFRVATFDDNRPPRATGADPSIVIEEDGQHALQIEHWFDDPDLDRGDHLQVSLIRNSAPQRIRFEPGSPAAPPRIVAEPDRVGTATLVLRASDDGGQFVDRTFEVLITPVNDPPITLRSPVRLTVDEDQSDVKVDLTTVFTDVDIEHGDDQLSYRVSANSNTALVDPQLDGAWLRLDLQADQHGSAEIVVEAEDLAGERAVARIELTVRSVLDGPRLALPLEQVTLNEDAAPVDVNLRGVFYSPEGFPITLQLVDEGDVDLLAAELTSERLRISPLPHRHGKTALTIRATDSRGAWLDASLDVVLRSINDAPQAKQPSWRYEREEDTDWLTIDLAQLFLDADLPDDRLTFTFTTDFASDLLEQKREGDVVSLRPFADRHGIDTARVQARDLAGAAATADLIVQINAVDDPPRLRKPFPDLLRTRGDADIAISLLDHFVEPDGQPISFTVSSSLPDVAAPTLDNDLLSIAISGQQSGVAQISISATDPDDLQTDAGFELIVNAKPTAIDVPPILMSEDAVPLTLSLDQLFRDDDVPEWEPTLNVAVQVTNGLDVIEADIHEGVLTITPRPDQHGDAQLKLTARDQREAEAVNVIDVTLLSANDRPHLVGEPSIRLQEDAEPIHVDLTSWFDDVDRATDDDQLRFELLGALAKPGVSISQDGNRLLVASEQDWFGQSFVGVRAIDRAGAFRDWTAELVVTNTNDPPRQIASVPNQTLSEDGEPLRLNLLELFTDLDVDMLDDQLQFSLSSEQPLLQTEIIGDVAILTPKPNAHGETRVTIHAADLAGETVSTEFLLKIVAIDDAPQTTIESPTILRVQGGQQQSFLLSDWFEDPDSSLTYAAALDGADGVTATIDAETLVLTAAANIDQAGWLRLTAVDDSGQSAELKVPISASPADLAAADRGSPPHVRTPLPDQWLHEDGGAVTIDLTEHFGDPDFQSLSYSAVYLPVTGHPQLVTPTLDGTQLHLTLAADWFGSGVVEVTATDSEGMRGTDEFFVDVASRNDTPWADRERHEVFLVEDQAPLILDVASWLRDDASTAGEMLSLDVLSSRPDLISTNWADGKLRLTPLPHRHSHGRAFEIVLVATDPGGASLRLPILVTIEARNDPARLVKPLEDLSLVEDGPPHEIQLLDHFFDVDLQQEATALRFRLRETHDDQLVRAEIRNQKLTILPRPNAFGDTTIAMEAIDDDGEILRTSFEVNVRPMNDRPTVAAPSGQRHQYRFAAGDDTHSISLEHVFEDLDDESLSYEVFIASGDPELFGTPPQLVDERVEFGFEPDSAGEAVILVRAWDAGGGTEADAYAEWSFLVEAIPYAPLRLLTGHRYRTIDVGEPLDLQLEADRDVEGATFGMLGLLPGMTIDEDTGVVQWTPGPDDAGLRERFPVYVEDPVVGGRFHDWVQLSVPANDSLPTSITLEPIPDVALEHGQAFSLPVYAHASDVDRNANLRFRLREPSGRLIELDREDDAPIFIYQTPDHLGVATYEVIVDDPEHGGDASQTFQVTVEDRLPRKFYDILGGYPVWIGPVTNQAHDPGPTPDPFQTWDVIRVDHAPSWGSVRTVPENPAVQFTPNAGAVGQQGFLQATIRSRQTGEELTYRKHIRVWKLDVDADADVNVDRLRDGYADSDARTWGDDSNESTLPFKLALGRADNVEFSLDMNGYGGAHIDDNAYRTQIWPRLHERDRFHVEVEVDDPAIVQFDDLPDDLKITDLSKARDFIRPLRGYGVAAKLRGLQVGSTTVRLRVTEPSGNVLSDEFEVLVEDPALKWVLPDRVPAGWEDADHDQIPDAFDGFNADRVTPSDDDDSPADALIPITLQIPDLDGWNSSQAELRIDYALAPLPNALPSGFEGNLQYPRASGIRLWRTNATQRTAADLVKPGRYYATELNLQPGDNTLYLEPVRLQHGGSIELDVEGQLTGERVLWRQSTRGETQVESRVEAKKLNLFAEIESSWVAANDGDQDADGLADALDGPDLNTHSMHGRMYNLRLALPGELQRDQARLSFKFAESRFLFGQDGHLRLWRTGESRSGNRLSLQAGGERIESNVEYTASQLNFQRIAEGDWTVTLVVEGVQATATPETIEIALEYTSPTDGSTLKTAAEVEVSVVAVDLDADTDNESNTSRTANEDEHELAVAVGNHVGVIAAVSDGDVDRDHIPDYADGLSLWGNEGDDAAAPFTPLFVTLPEPIDPELALLRFDYSESDPAELALIQQEGRNVFQLPNEGYARIWTRDGDQTRRTYPVFAGGDFIPAGAAFSANQIGEGRELVFFLETVRPSEAFQHVQLHVDPDGWSGPAPFAAFDAIAASSVQLDLQLDVNRDGDIALWEQTSERSRDDSAKDTNVWIAANLGDVDQDTQPDFADGMEPDQENSSAPFQPVSLVWRGPEKVRDQSWIELVYDDSDPLQVAETEPVHPAGGLFTAAPGALRVWKLDGPQPRDPQSIAAPQPGDFWSSEEAVALSTHLDQDKPTSLFVEAVRPVAKPLSIDARLRYGAADGPSSAQDSIELVSIFTDLNLDSDNDTVLKGNLLEDQIENAHHQPGNSIQNPDFPGLIVGRHDRDRDDDGIPDFADWEGVVDAPPSHPFLPLDVLVPTTIDLNEALFRFDYPASHPQNIASRLRGDRHDIRIESSDTETRRETLRIWNRDGQSNRLPWSLDLSGYEGSFGNFIEDRAYYDWSQLGGAADRHTLRLFVEGVDYSDDWGAEAIHVTVDPDGSGPRPDMLLDSVRATVVNTQTVSVWAANAIAGEDGDRGQWIISRGDDSLGDLVVHAQLETIDLDQFYLQSNTPLKQNDEGELQITIPAGSTQSVITLWAEDDDDSEWDQTVRLRVLPPNQDESSEDESESDDSSSDPQIAPAYRISGAHAIATIEILDDDGFSAARNTNADWLTTEETPHQVGNDLVQVRLHDGSVRLIEPWSNSDFSPTFVDTTGSRPTVLIDFNLPLSTPFTSTRLETRFQLAALPSVPRELELPQGVTELRLAFPVDANSLPSGRHPYVLEIHDPATGATRTLRGSANVMHRDQGLAVQPVSQLAPFDELNPVDVDLFERDGTEFARAGVARRLIERGARSRSGVTLLRGDQTAAWFTASDFSFTSYSDDERSAAAVDYADFSADPERPWTSAGFGDGFRGDWRRLPAGDNQSSAQWTLRNLRVGQPYQLFATWTPGLNRTAAASYDIQGAVPFGRRQAGQTVHVVDQRFTPGELHLEGAAWRSLGFYTATSPQITIGLRGNGDGVVSADAVAAVGHWSFSSATGGYSGLQHDGSVDAADAPFILSDNHGGRRVFSRQGLLHAHRTRLQNETRFEYGDADRDGFPEQLAAIIEQGGRRHQYRYQDGRLTNYIDHAGRETVFERLPDQLLVQREPTPGAAPESWILQFDAESRLSQWNAPDGTEFHFRYDAHGTLNGVDLPTVAAGEVSWEFETIDSVSREQADQQEVQASWLDAGGHRWRFDVDAFGYLVAEWEPSAESPTRWTRNTHGQVLTETTAAGAGGVANFDHPLTTAYRYDDSGNLAERIRADGARERFRHDAVNGQLLEHTDAVGRVIRVKRDSRGAKVEELLAADSSDERRFRFVYSATPLSLNDVPGGLTTITVDPLGRITANDYYASGAVGRLRSRRTAANSPEQRTTTFDYDDDGRLISQTDFNGAITSFAYDSLDRVISQVDPAPGDRWGPEDHAAAIHEYQYNVWGNLERETHPASVGGLTTTYQFDPLQRLVEERRRGDSDGLEVAYRYEYDRQGNRITEIDPRGARRRFNFDPAGRLIARYEPSIGDEEAAPTRWTYDSAGNIATKQWTVAVKSPNGDLQQHDVSIDFTYDRLGRLTRRLLPAPLSTSTIPEALDPPDVNQRPAYEYSWFADGSLASVTNPVNATTSYDYDLLGQRIATFGPLGQTERYDYDAAGRLRRQVDGEGVATIYRYDEHDRPRLVRGGGRDERHVYDDLLSTSISYIGTARSVTYFDQMGRPQRTEVETIADGQPQRIQSKWDYDAAGNVVRQVDPNQVALQFQFDSLGRLRETVREGAQTVRIEQRDYDDVNNLISLTDGEGDTTRFEYDLRGRRTKTIMPPTQQHGASETRFRYDLNDHLIAVVDQFGVTNEFFYDALGRHVERRFANGLPEQATTQVVFDAADQAVLARNELGAWTRVTYDDAGQVVSVERPDPETGLPSNERRDRYDHDRGGRLIRHTDPAGTIHEFQYDRYGHVRFERRGGGQGAAGASWSREYRRNALGLVLNSAEYVGPQYAASGFHYDSANRLIAVTDPVGATRSLTLDPGGNIVTATDPIGNRTAYEYDDAGAVTVIRHPDAAVERLQYDANGRLIEHADPLGRIQRVRYDSRGRIVARQSPIGVWENWEYSVDSNEVLYVDAHGGRTKREHDARDRVQRIERLDSGYDDYQTFVYDAAGNLIARRDAVLTGPLNQPKERSTAMRYDLAGRLTELAEPHDDASYQSTDQVTAYEYDNADRLLSTQAANGERQQFDYDALGNVVMHSQTISPPWAPGLKLRAVTRSRYDAQGNRIVFIDAERNRTLLTYDAAGRLQSEQNSKGGVQHLQYDAAGRLIVRVDAEGRATAYQRDSRGRVVTEGWFADRTEAFRFVSETPGPNPEHWVATTYDLAGEPVRIEDATTSVTTFQRDAKGRLTQQTQTNKLGGPNVVQRFEYLAHSPWIAAAHTDLSDHGSVVTESYQFSPYGEVVELRQTGPWVADKEINFDRNGQGQWTSWSGALIGQGSEEAVMTAEARYDVGGRVRELVYRSSLGPDPIASYQLQYQQDSSKIRQLDRVDPGQQSERFQYAYDRHGQLTEVTSAGGTQRYRYTENGNPYDRGALVGANNELLRFQRLWNQNDQRGFTFAYDGNGARVSASTVTTTLIADDRSTNNATSFNVVAGHWQRVDVGYQDRSRSSADAHAKAAWEFPLARPGVYDVFATWPTAGAQSESAAQVIGGSLEAIQSGAGIPLAIIDQRQSPQADLQANDTIWQAVGRLELDSVGAGVRIERAQSQPQKQLIADAVMLQRQDELQQQYRWDHRGRLIGVSTFAGSPSRQVQAVRFRYDGLNRRIAKLVDRTEPFDFVDADVTHEIRLGQAEQIRLHTDGVKAVYLQARVVDQVLTEDISHEGGLTTLWRIADHTAGPTGFLVTDENRPGERDVYSHYRYDAFGQQIAPASAELSERLDGYVSPGAFHGRPLDRETGLQLHRARYYDPAARKWISPDPWGLAAGDANLTRFAGNDPIRFVDPDGLQAAEAMGRISERLHDAAMRIDDLDPALFNPPQPPEKAFDELLQKVPGLAERPVTRQLLTSLMSNHTPYFTPTARSRDLTVGGLATASHGFGVAALVSDPAAGWPEARKANDAFLMSLLANTEPLNTVRIIDDEMQMGAYAAVEWMPFVPANGLLRERFANDLRRTLERTVVYRALLVKPIAQLARTMEVSGQRLHPVAAANGRMTAPAVNLYLDHLSPGSSASRVVRKFVNRTARALRDTVVDSVRQVYTKIASQAARLRRWFRGREELPTTTRRVVRDDAGVLLAPQSSRLTGDALALPGAVDATMVIGDNVDLRRQLLRPGEQMLPPNITDQNIIAGWVDRGILEGRDFLLVTKPSVRNLRISQVRRDGSVRRGFSPLFASLRRLKVAGYVANEHADGILLTHSVRSN